MGRVQLSAEMGSSKVFLEIGTMITHVSPSQEDAKAREGERSSFPIK